jgi:hypothetical protein
MRVIYTKKKNAEKIEVRVNTIGARYLPKNTVYLQLPFLLVQETNYVTNNT